MTKEQRVEATTIPFRFLPDPRIGDGANEAFNLWFLVGVPPSLLGFGVPFAIRAVAIAEVSSSRNIG